MSRNEHAWNPFCIFQFGLRRTLAALDLFKSNATQGRHKSVEGRVNLYLLESAAHYETVACPRAGPVSLKVKKGLRIARIGLIMK